MIGLALAVLGTVFGCAVLLPPAHSVPASRASSVAVNAFVDGPSSMVTGFLMTLSLLFTCPASYVLWPRTSKFHLVRVAQSVWRLQVVPKTFRELLELANSLQPRKTCHG
jgi:hypothetical protein